MRQMKIDPSVVVPIDYESGDVHPTIRELKPVVFRDGDAYCCLLGPDMQLGVTGCGVTAKEAQADWVNHLQQYLQSANTEDELLQEIKDQLSLTKDDVW